MSNAPQNQNQPAKNSPSSSQGVAETSKGINSPRKDEKMGGMKGEACTSSDNKPKQGGCN